MAAARLAALPYGLPTPPRSRSDLFVLTRRPRAAAAIPTGIAIAVDPLAEPAIGQWGAAGHQ